uniref:Annexin n=1 Tax=Plectus sambesii TaxID=2011161 RepID=A0A914WV14_9BILA
MSLDCQGTIREYPSFTANGDAEALHKAMKGLGCNDTAVAGILCARSSAQRQQIALAYKTMYGKDLCDSLKSELKGDFEDLILALMETPARYDARQLREAMKGMGTNEKLIIEIMCTRSNHQIHAIKADYKQMYNRDLEKDLKSETGGHFERLLVSLSCGGRDESNNVDMKRAEQDAEALYKAGEKRFGTDESMFNSILATQNFAQLRKVFAVYGKFASHDIEKAIENEMSGDLRDGLLTVVRCAKNRPAYFATCLHDAMKGFGTRDKDLIRVIVTRCEVDMVQIKSEFYRLFEKQLEAVIQGDCSGSYKNGLIALVKGN